jgi:capsular polysaccharide export protein
MESALDGRQTGLTEVPDHWGDMREHMFWGAIYHASLFRGRKRYQNFQPHRTPDVRGEFWLYLRRLLQTPRRAIVRKLATSHVRHGGFPYHLVLLQLAHDANFREHGPFPNQAAFLETDFKGFSAGAPRHHHLVLKAHPLEDGREPLRPLINRLTKAFDLEGRTHFLSGGKLAPLLNTARSAVTVNSTAAEQVLWRGLPLKVFGAAIYHRDEFCSSQSAAGFFHDPELPNREAYLQYRSFLLSTSQIAGGFYALRNRRKLLRQLPDIMLNEFSPYEQLLAPKAQDAASRQHLTQV